jgi:CubicO group peptidase (beta-lactamase class C family)
MNFNPIIHRFVVPTFDLRNFRFMKSLQYVILLLLASSCSLTDNATKRNSELDAFFAAQFPADAPGGAILVMKNDSIIFAKGYGLADITTKEPITTKTLFNLGSISKTFVANAILMLQEEGKLSVEDSIVKYFPDFRKPEFATKVRIKHLLTHTSGLPDNRQVDRDTTFYLTAKDAENWYPVTQAENMIFQPGTRYEYSNPAYNALALIVEKVSGMRWQTYIEEKILKPSGMLTSTITDGEHPQSGVSHGYVLNGGKWTEDDYGEEPTFAAAGNGGVWSSVEELAKYEQALRDSVFLKAETIAVSRTIKTFNPWGGSRKPFIGWSWFVDKTSDGLTTVGHTGSQGGFLCNYVTVPGKNIFFVILCNTPADVPGYTDKIFSWLREQKWLDE